MLALVRVDVSKCTTHLNGFERTFLETFLTTDTTDITVLHSDSAFFNIDAANINTTVVLAFRTNLDDASRTSFCTCAATNAFVFVNDGDAFFLVDVDGVESTFLDTVAETETCIRTSD